ncbi:hypothetical protein BMS3Abin02_02062 [bacterium BMS3Abin02]|nr:hypothetical protein BMS3Abin02_02062 [bacterium BMS3Abin02]GBE22615.1 hypothetical protein BMS3Bbin01_01991 [bacterium BMS3Bbin01]
MRVRPPAVAGTFYPRNPSRLRSMIEGFLATVEADTADHPKAIITPHAGYLYSGPIAATAYATLDRDLVHRVVVIGPSHFVWFEGLALPGVDSFRTPLGDIPLVESLPMQFPVIPSAHAREHSIEVQLPFLQVVLDQFDLLPLVVGDADPALVAAALEALEGGPETLIVISSDLSHYLAYEDARRVDSTTASQIVNRQGSALARDSACGLRGIQGVLLFAERHQLPVRLLDLRNSGDTAGDKERVVGYGAFAIG